MNDSESDSGPDVARLSTQGMGWLAAAVYRTVGGMRSMD